MYQLKMPLKEYEKMKECLLALHPEIDLECISCDTEARRQDARRAMTFDLCN